MATARLSCCTTRSADTVVLVRQLRWAATAAGHRELMIEAPAGLLDADSPEDRIRAEASRKPATAARSRGGCSVPS